MLLADEDIGHGALARDVLEGGLDGGTVVWEVVSEMCCCSSLSCKAWLQQHTNLVQLDGVELCAAVRQQLLRGAAVGAVGL